MEYCARSEIPTQQFLKKPCIQQDTVQWKKCWSESASVGNHQEIPSSILPTGKITNNTYYSSTLVPGHG